ncbi:MAG: RNA 2',3'-cyclic phosphodiesterase [Oscillospiraceae bacterium]|nr:RNA 2',3'-cyclic phosphodiesterase [Oscillospiraceae bacterium]
MRLFVSVELSEAVRAVLIKAQNDLYDCGVRGSYAPEENLHLTLAFIGEYPDPEPVLEALSAVSFTGFELCTESTGSFGDLLWAGIRRSPPLETLARRIRHALAESGVPFDRKRFSPHITLLRRARGDVPELRLGEASMTVESFSLMRSDRGKNGMIYTELGRFTAERQ